mgnify:CR=1 FL=1
MLLYVGPDLLMPLASILGAIGGAILLFWNRVVDLTRAILGRGNRESDEEGAEPVDGGKDSARVSPDSIGTGPSA